MADNIFYVYQYINEDGQPYYIGKGSGKRIDRPHTSTLLPPKERRVIIKDGLSNEEAKRLEGNLITKYKRKLDGGILDNIKINQWACAVGWKHSEETKRKISEGNRGKKRTPEQLKNYKGTVTVEHREKIRQANLGRRDDPSRHPRRNEPMDTMQRKKISTSLKRYFAERDPNKPWNKKGPCQAVVLEASDGVKYQYESMTQGCKEHNLVYSKMSQVKNGYLAHHRGWTVTQVQNNG